MFYIVLGTSYSGSGFLFDYIESSETAFAPLGDREYLLGHIPYGFTTLANCLARENAHTATTDHFVKKFFEVANGLGTDKAIWNTGMAYAKHLPNYNSALQNLREAMTLSIFDYDLYWKWFDSSLCERFASRINLGSKTRRRITTTDLAIDVECLARNFHQHVFRDNFDTKPTLLNQAGIPTSPLHSTRFYNDRKVMVVVRDPRDQFAELKAFKHMSDVKAFCIWYENFMHEIWSIRPNQNLRVWKFENLVLDFNKMSREINKFLGISGPTTYQYSESKKNIGKFRRELSAAEIKYIEKNLGYFLNDF